jgi:hypothetical protein
VTSARPTLCLRQPYRDSCCVDIKTAQTSALSSKTDDAEVLLNGIASVPEHVACRMTVAPSARSRDSPKLPVPEDPLRETNASSLLHSRVDSPYCQMPVPKVPLHGHHSTFVRLKGISLYLKGLVKASPFGMVARRVRSSTPRRLKNHSSDALGTTSQNSHTIVLAFTVAKVS